ncbi:MAG: HDOD domain-containing protein [Desulfobulbaceae bacterium]|nr:HDOD domain-containing protein [Desulfobulbaceae bacterium]
MPQSLHQVLSELDATGSTASSLESIIGQDPMLTARILRVANSPAYGSAKKISSVTRAVTVLGFNEVRNLVVALSLSGSFSSDLGSDEFSVRQLWLHLVATARVAQILARQIPALKPDEMFTAGLIHDLGRVLSCLYLQEEMRQIIETSRNEGLSILEVEQRHGLSHAEVGTFLAVKWGFSDLLASVVRYHHAPTGAGKHEQAAALVFLADGIAKKLGLGWDLAVDNDKLLVPRCLGLSGETVKAAAKRLHEEKEDLVNTWSQILFT